MITSAANRPWPGDCPITDYAGSGLPIPSVVRPAKITTIQIRDADRIGAVDAAVRTGALTAIQTSLGS